MSEEREEYEAGQSSTPINEKTEKRTLKIKVTQAQDGQWYNSLVAGNGEVLSCTETYTRRSTAVDRADKLAALFTDDIEIVIGARHMPDPSPKRRKRKQAPASA